MRFISAVDEMERAIGDLKSSKKTIGFVPTMGCLHEGHMALVRESGRRAGATVVSIFVNPAQFGPKEDLNAYPRDLKRDSALLEKEDVAILFCPGVQEMYPHGYKTYVEVHDLQDRLCGRSRPGHFRGVSTVVLKLFEIIQPDVAFFGQKDAQQVVIIKKMVEDLNLGVAIEALPTVREPDGLALSSRNAYLNPDERKAALVLYQGLKTVQKLFSQGERQADLLLGEIRSAIAREPLARIDYVEIVNPRTLEPIFCIENQALIALAVFIGKTRLIDNVNLSTG